MWNKKRTWNNCPANWRSCTPKTRWGCWILFTGPNLKSLRKAVKLTQEQVAAQLQLRGLDVSREMYCQMEQGRYSVRISVLKALKDIYKAPSYDEFFKGL